MTRMRRTLVAVVVLVSLSILLVWGAQISEQDVYKYIDDELVVWDAQTKKDLKEALTKGFQEKTITPELAMQLLEVVNDNDRMPELKDRDRLLLAIATTLNEGLPAELLVRKVREGVARGVSTDEILTWIEEYKHTLAEVKDLLLNKKGIRIQAQPDQPGFPAEAVYAAITDISAVLEDHVRSGRDPNDGGSIMTKVGEALRKDGRIREDLRNDLLSKLGADDLVPIANHILDRLEGG